MGSKLISIGCSFTDHGYFPKAYNEPNPKDHIFWDQYFAEYLNLELINYGRSGAGGDHHMAMLAEAIAVHGKDIDSIIIGWSGWDRYNYPYFYGPELVNPRYDAKYDNDAYNAIAFDKINTSRKIDLAVAAFKSVYAQMYMATKLADSINAKLLIVQMIAPTAVHLPSNFRPKKKLTPLRWYATFGVEVIKLLYKVTEENPLFNVLAEDSRLPGFPFIKRLNGFYMWDEEPYKNKYDQLWEEMKKELIVGRTKKNKVKFKNGERVLFDELDRHPNAAGQKYIFNRMRKHWDEIYK